MSVVRAGGSCSCMPVGGLIGLCRAEPQAWETTRGPDTTYVAFDTSKETLAVAIAESGRHKEVRFFGAIASRPEAVHKLIDKLAMQHPRPAFCYGAGPTGYGLCRQIRAMGYECRVVVAPMVPVRRGGHIKTDRRDATTLAALFRAGELTAILSVGLASRLAAATSPAPSRNLRRPMFMSGSFQFDFTSHRASSRRKSMAPRSKSFVFGSTSGLKVARPVSCASPWIGRRGGKSPFSVVAPVAATQKAAVSWATSLACETSGAVTNAPDNHPGLRHYSLISNSPFWDPVAGHRLARSVPGSRSHFKPRTGTKVDSPATTQ